LQDIPAHLFAINHITFSPQGNWFATCSMDKSIKIWDTQHFKLLKVIDKARYAGHGTSVNKLVWTNYQDFLVSGSDDRTLSLWEITEIKESFLKL
jgi:WD40 repeat protein